MGLYHFGWSDREGNPTNSGWGKGFRSALAFASATACGAEAAAALPAAVAVELLHNFTLVHDDVMDGDRLRRGRATVWDVWGAPAAICLGDALHAMAVRVLAGDRDADIADAAVSRLELAAVHVCRGQCQDCAFEAGGHVEIDDYLTMAAAKTGVLMGCACALGALFAAGASAPLAAFETFGRDIGVAFQITDDILGIWGDPARTGKAVGADVMRRKRSFPILLALESETAAGQELSRLYHGTAPISPAHATRLARLMESEGCLQRCERRADMLVRTAVSALPGDAVNTDLAALAHSVVHRTR
ncbi:polyprenyl synthetase family protein [Nocardia blacklockiae]|uniref:polyprenyl synthetase family protein n=1 Tax=Nocardia blacklockiae TaxID=480036 RepID=UPI001E2842A1|nr:polyprenyl synthetase family protein [Nocardia blacklockiae]